MLAPKAHLSLYIWIDSAEYMLARQCDKFQKLMCRNINNRYYSARSRECSSKGIFMKIQIKSAKWSQHTPLYIRTPYPEILDPAL